MLDVQQISWKNLKNEPDKIFMKVISPDIKDEYFAFCYIIKSTYEQYKLDNFKFIVHLKRKIGNNKFEKIYTYSNESKGRYLSTTIRDFQIILEDKIIAQIRKDKIKILLDK